MRPYWVLLALFGAAVSAQSSASSSEDSQTSETSTTEQSSETSTTDESSSTSSDNNQDTTVTVTETVTGDGSTVSSRTTRTITSTTVIVDVSTVRETTTVTSRDQETATKTEYTTTTIFQKRKRDVWLLEAEPAEAEPIITPAPELDAGLVDAGLVDAEMARREAAPGVNVFKRDTITETETVTEGGSDTTVVATVTATVVTASTSRSTTTETITETDQAGASTTVTTTRTLTETSNTFSTDVFTETGGTTTGPPQTTGGAGGGGGGGGGGGLSTGAKAGIGAGAGVAGLAIIAGLAWFCLKKRRGGAKHDDHDDMFGASEVPVGAAAVGSTSSRPMAHQPSTSASYGGPNRSPVLPNVAPEGYRGTAMGDGRSGYAKPEPYGAAYTRPSAQHPPPNSVSPVSPPTTGYSYPTNRTSTLQGSGNGADHLPEHQTPAEYSAFGGGRAPSTSPGPHAAELGNEGHTARWQNPGATEVDTTPAGFHQSQQPPPNVYEMPGQDPR